MSGLASQVVAEVQRYRQHITSLLLYRSVFNSSVGQALLKLLNAICGGDSDSCLKAYADWFQALATSQQSWRTHLVQQILQAENPFSLQAQQYNPLELPNALIAAARQDLRTLQALYEFPSEQLSRWVQTVCQLPQAPITWEISELPSPLKFPSLPDWGEGLTELANHYHRHGTGIFAQYRAFRWQQSKLIGVATPDPIQLAQLAAYDGPRADLIRNTQFLLAGYPALHVLLYGSRGSGKSSLVKALLNEYCDRGLRLVEVAKSDLRDLPLIVDELRAVPLKFILFVDDLSFEEDDEAFKALKVVLEGSVTARPQNVVVYATSNRRHLVREYFSERPRPNDQDEIQAWDTLQEKLSFSDRFGLTLTFEPADQKTYLAIVYHLAQQAGIGLSEEDLTHQALQWATRHNGRSGRTARQFIDFLNADLKLSAQ
ncbi:MAG TPA: ATP-binding protein [Leptolyngbyaceae cyanobacterium]